MSEPTVRRRRTIGESNGAEERTRTFTVLLPPAPQAGASANSATSARRVVQLLSRCRGRWCRCRRRRWLRRRGSRSRRCARACRSTSADDRASSTAVLTSDTDIERANDEQHRAHGRRTRQHSRAAARTERRLGCAAAERVRHAAAFALLQQHDHDQGQADDDVNSDRNVIKHRESFENRKQ